MNLITLWNQYHQLSLETLADALSHEFPQLMIQISLKNKQFITNYLNILSTHQPKDSQLLTQIIHLIQKNASQKELRDFLKVFYLPLGLRYQLAQFISLKLIGNNEGQLLFDSIYITQQISSSLLTSGVLSLTSSAPVSSLVSTVVSFPSVLTSGGAVNRTHPIGTVQLKVFHPNWKCFLTVEKSAPILTEDHFHKIRARCYQWISIGSHPNLVPGYFCRLDSTKQHLLLFSESIEPRLTLHEFLESQSHMKQMKMKEGKCASPPASTSLNEPAGGYLLSSEKDVWSQVQCVFHLMISLCHGVEVLHNKGLPHLNLTPEKVLLAMREQTSPEEIFHQCVISSICLADPAHLSGLITSIFLLSFTIS
jgi:hypothetical protein